MRRRGLSSKKPCKKSTSTFGSACALRAKPCSSVSEGRLLALSWQSQRAKHFTQNLFLKRATCTIPNTIMFKGSNDPSFLLRSFCNDLQWTFRLSTFGFSPTCWTFGFVVLASVFRSLTPRNKHLVSTFSKKNDQCIKVHLLRWFPAILLKNVILGLAFLVSIFRWFAN